MVPIIVDPEGVSGEGEVGELADVEKDRKEGEEFECGRFAHAGETVRAYIRENELTLVSIICISPSPLPSPATPHLSLSPPSPLSTHPHPPSLTTAATDLLLPRDSLVNTPESTLHSIYRTNVLDPVSVVRELSDVLVSPLGFGPEYGARGVTARGVTEYWGRGRGKQSQGRVIFINPSPILSPSLQAGSSAGGHVDSMNRHHHRLLQTTNLSSVNSVNSLTTSLRSATARILRDELSVLGVGVCEVVVGPMWEKPRLARCWGGGEEGRKMPTPGPTPTRLLILSRLWAVDDALLFASVRRALEDRYPRYRHYAGLGPLVDDLAGAIPGGGVMTGLGRWVVGKVLG